jgi:tRNA(Ile)-lysidine synthase
MALEAGADLVLLAHHRRDQAETFLLQSMRGGGAAALSAMPSQARHDGVTWARPWLGRSRDDIERYVRAHRLAPVEDESNGDVRFARSRLRTVVWPAFVDAFPDVEASLAVAARHAQDAAMVLAEVAEGDLALVACGASLDIAAWRSLSAPRRGNALRAWLRRHCGSGVPRSVADRLDAELMPVGERRWSVPGGELRSYRGRLRIVSGQDALQDPGGDPLRREFPGWEGALVARPVREDGFPAAAFQRLALRLRQPADRFQAGPGRPPRSLKLQYQAAGVPEWERTGPIVCDGERLVFVPGLGLDARVVAPAGVPQLALRWVSR